MKESPATHEDIEDVLYNSEIIEANLIVFLLEQSGEGASNNEIAIALHGALLKFGDAIENAKDREDLAEGLERHAYRLRNEPAPDTAAKPWLSPRGWFYEATMIMQSHAEQDGTAEDGDV